MVAYSFKKRFIVPIKMGLGLPYEIDDIVVPGAGPKLQTCRATYLRRHAKPGECLQLYTGMRTKQCKLIGEAVCTEVIPVIIWISEKAFAIELDRRLLTTLQIGKFARSDGFTCLDDMASFWRTEHAGVAKFEGVCIKWEAGHGR